MLYITTRIVKTYTSVEKIPRVPVENEITTLTVVKIAIKFSPCSDSKRFSYSKKKNICYRMICYDSKLYLLK